MLHYLLFLSRQSSTRSGSLSLSPPCNSFRINTCGSVTRQRTLSLWNQHLRKNHRGDSFKACTPIAYHSAYFVPSSAVPCDFECTSYTFPPPQDVESGSS